MLSAAGAKSEKSGGKRVTLPIFVFSSFGTQSLNDNNVCRNALDRGEDVNVRGGDFRTTPLMEAVVNFRESSNLKMENDHFFEPCLVAYHRWGGTTLS